MWIRLLLVVVVSTLLTTLITAAITKEEIRLDEKSIIPFEEFGFTRHGHLNLTLSRLSLFPQPRCDPTGAAGPKLGFFLCKRRFFKDIAGSGGAPCAALQSPSVLPVLTLDPLAPPESSYSVVYNITSQPTEPYVLVFANCLPHYQVSMDVRAESYNAVNGKRDYLSIGMTSLPGVYLLFSIAYFVLLGVLWNDAERTEEVHSFMLVAVASNSLGMLFEADSMMYVKKTGFDCGTGWYALLFILFGIFPGIMSSWLIALIGMGWSSLKKQPLQSKDVMLLTLLLLAQFVAPTFRAWPDMPPTFSDDWWFMKQLFLVCDFGSCLLFSLLVDLSIRDLRENGSGNNSIKIALFIRYGWGLAAYIFLTKVVVLPLEFVFSYEYSWTRFVVGELATLGFYVFMAYILRPGAHNPYFMAIEEEKKEGGFVGTV